MPYIDHFVYNLYTTDVITSIRIYLIDSFRFIGCVLSLYTYLYYYKYYVAYLFTINGYYTQINSLNMFNPILSFNN
jgi:hypothetical protein